MTEAVNHPAHYNASPSGVECIDVIEHMPFNIGNAIKYLWRADHKGVPIEDLRKAAWYINREIERRTRTAPLHDATELVRLRQLAAIWHPSLNRRAAVEQLLLDAANGKRGLPGPEELRAWALRLGTPDEVRT